MVDVVAAQDQERHGTGGDDFTAEHEISIVHVRAKQRERGFGDVAASMR
ncbi:MAG TPA: hypothetical protein VFK05_07645 [Polyangiaceae bacterium]|nr:hypothetical protein [Polyangiaceae bacterium]